MGKIGGLTNSGSGVISYNQSPYPQKASAKLLVLNRNDFTPANNGMPQ